MQRAFDVAAVRSSFRWANVARTSSVSRVLLWFWQVSSAPARDGMRQKGWSDPDAASGKRTTRSMPRVCQLFLTWADIFQPGDNYRLRATRSRPANTDLRCATTRLINALRWGISLINLGVLTDYHRKTAPMLHCEFRAVSMKYPMRSIIRGALLTDEDLLIYVRF